MSNFESNSGCDSSNIFGTQFGDVPERKNSAPIFSGNNPPSDCSQLAPQQLRFGISAEEYGNPYSVDVKKRKRRERSLGLDSGGAVDEAWEIPLEIKKQKRVESRSSDFGERKIPDFFMDFEPKSQEEKGTEEKKKKRKRDELEADYEAGNYGFVAGNDGEGEGGLGGKVAGKKRKKFDDPLDMVVSKEGLDDEAKLLKTVIVGNLPLKVKKKALLEEFSQFGEVESVRIHSIPLYPPVSFSVHAYIVFRTDQASLASLAHNMAVVGGNHIRVVRACPPRKKLKEENDLKGGSNLLFGEEIHGQKLQGRELRTYHARSSLTPSKRKDPSSPREGDDAPTKKFAGDSGTSDNCNMAIDEGS